MSTFTPTPSIQTPHSSVVVAILLCTYHGEKYLTDQLASIETQDHPDWVVYASDDGSSDRTIEILHDFQSRWPVGRLHIRKGPQQGFCRNFLSLACDPNIEADYYAFCDQDDVWLADKLSSALQAATAALQDSPSEVFLYCGRTQYVNKILEPCGMSPLFVFPPSFRNALVQSIAGGNTMLFNLAAKRLIEKVGSVDVPLHDWWIYQLISGADGLIVYDPTPHLLYRQHEEAQVGGSHSIFSVVKPIMMLLGGRFRNWNTKNTAALESAVSLLSKNNQEILRLFEKIRNASLKDRIRLIEVCGVYRQTYRGTLSLLLATIFKRV
ncbi:glycosyltransferase family 2 protein [Polynucleobacter sp. 31A-FELB]|uniref:glycosyltransferase family 2 protein n=1 Tax=Polynucleobacter sp. 31A-FELB TaxID=2689096 RepID=UPI001C0D72D0|nr:glycosyltransferase family 2 protein [Polynucleobacter sp. 31A-FELB]MBU3588108.1 glycosyltransferase family 2 protein [Polynucleobacter sp. 31A-FELB]